MNSPLEDSFEDIVRKAARGLGVSLGALPSGEQEVRALAVELGLEPNALVGSARQSWAPAPAPAIEGFAMFTTPFGDMAVNSYLVFDPSTHEGAAVDTGSDVSAMLATGIAIRKVLLTHLHGDHIFDLDRLVERTGAEAWCSEREPIEGARAFAWGERFRIGCLDIETRRSSGHAAGGTTYVVRGLERVLAFVGDALFAGSMGGAASAYREALDTARAGILTLPDDAILCPGHGPLTTVGEERVHNPFFARR